MQACQRDGLAQRKLRTIKSAVPMPEQYHPRGVTMRDCFSNRGGFDRVVVAVAATLLAVSATSALAQGDQARSSAAELAIDAAIPRPEPANVPPPTASDFKMDSSATAAAAPPALAKSSETKPADVATAPPTAGAVPAAPATETTIVAPALAPAIPLAPAMAAAPSARPQAMFRPPTSRSPTGSRIC